jgi:predicted ATPase/class 3 adenylate cyclase
VQGRGFEPLKAEPAGLQPAPFGHSGTPAGERHCSGVPADLWAPPAAAVVHQLDVVLPVTRYGRAVGSDVSFPHGTVTFLFTDIEGSTRLLRELGDEYPDALAGHRRALREEFMRHGGVEVDAQGDAFFVVFAKASDALAAAAGAREALGDGPIRVRMGLHTGEPTLTEEGYVGIDVHRAARIAAAGHGGQILLSQATRDLAGAERLRDLGVHRLKDLAAPERLYQLGDDAFPPLKSVDQTNLPVQPTPFVGRERELAEVLALVDVHHVVTLTGPGGAGKTRLALQAAAESVEQYGDGVWFVSLAAVEDPQQIEPTIARVVGGPDDLHAFLSGKRTLLVLDNLEQLLPDAADVVARLDARILATSRGRLNIAAEQEFPVPTLPIDDAAALFTQRARQLEPRFEPDASVRQIVERLDGLPLAVELAAARVKVLTPGQILERLGRSLDLLTSGAHDAPERQRTLRGTVEWSHRLLTSDEQRLFARLAVFAGSFELDAAEAVCSAELDVLQSLVDKSLLRRGEDGRFFMLTTIKELALEKLRDLPDASSVRRRHDDYFLAVAEELEARERLSGLRDLSAESLNRFERELPNFRAALAGLLEDGRRESVLRLGAALWRFWLNRAQYRDAADWLEKAPLDDATLPLEVRAAALGAAGGIAYYTHDDVDGAERFWREGLELRRVQDDPHELGAALSRLASVAWRRGDFDGAIAYHKQSLPLYQQGGAESLLLTELHWLGDAYRDRGDYDEAERLLQETAARARELGLDQQLTSTLHSLGDLSLDRVDPRSALERFAEGLTYAVATGSRRVQIYCIAGIACALLQQGDDRAAARLWGIAEDQEHRLGFRMLLTERQRYERLMSGARERLGASYETEHRAGAGLTLEQAVAKARLHVPA